MTATADPAPSGHRGRAERPEVRRVLAFAAGGFGALCLALPIAVITTFEGERTSVEAASSGIQTIALFLLLAAVAPGALTRGRGWARVALLISVSILVVPAFALAVAGVDVLVDFADSDAGGGRRPRAVAGGPDGAAGLGGHRGRCRHLGTDPGPADDPVLIAGRSAQLAAAWPSAAATGSTRSITSGT